MSWFWLALTALLCWSGSDLFSKIGCRDGRDKYGYLKMVMAVGLIMGLHAVWEMTVGGVSLTAMVALRYLPVSLLYISSMALGYLGLRYIELSISSPICNASGALVAILYLCTGGLDDELSAGARAAVLCAIMLVCGGVIGLGVVETREDDALRAARQAASNYRYVKSALALLLPVIYCVLDALGTFFDTGVIGSLAADAVGTNAAPELLEAATEDMAAACNVAYELTFFAVGVLCAIYVLIIRRQKLVARAELPKYAGAVFETAGQFAYIFAIADADHVLYAAPMISAYCAASVVWSRIFLKEKLSVKHYLCIGVVVIGIVLLGVFDI